MESHARRIDVEHRMRELLESGGLPPPARVEYGATCVRFFFEPQMVCVVVDLDELEGDAEVSS